MASSPSLLFLVASLAVFASVADCMSLDGGRRFSDDVVRMSMLTPALRLPRRLVGFSWNDCGGPDALVKLKGLSVSPDPVRLSGPITVAFSASVSSPVAAPVAVSVTLEREIFGRWIKLPCIDGVGSCTYGNACGFAPATCPPPFVAAKIPCQCPVPAGNYTLPSSTFQIHASIPSFLESGNYRANVQGAAAGRRAFCIAVKASLD